MNSETRSPPRTISRFRLSLRRLGVYRKLAFSLVIAAVISGIATVATMTGSSMPDPDPRTILALLYVDTIVLLLLSAVVARRLVLLWAERRQGLAGSGLHVRLAVLFSLVAVTPAILVTVFSGLFLNFGIHAWFSERIRTVVSESRVVAHAYLQEHQKNIRAEALAMANDLNRDAPLLLHSPIRFANFLSTQAAVRNISEAMVIDAGGKVMARTQFSLALEFDIISQEKFREADKNDIALLINDSDDRVRAIVKLSRHVDTYLVVGRFIEPGVLEHIERTDRAASQYKRLEESRKGIQITFVMIFAIVALLILLAAIWVGLALATRLVRPVSSLIVAAERVRKGDLTARVSSTAAGDEISTLSRVFNRMTGQLEEQQLGLIEANRLLDERRRFTEAVLTGVSAGVIGLDKEGRINLPNRAASELLKFNIGEFISQPLSDVIPEMSNLLEDVVEYPDRSHQSQMQLSRDGTSNTILVRVVAERLGDDIVGYVVTFDDITELQSAQRMAAWADIAQRIAHEIKNPLTPIQLSAERLKRRYLPEITSDPDTFSACTDTIVRQVEEIGQMVDEFSSFARMPQAVMKLENITEICRQSVLLEQNRYPDITFELSIPKQAIKLVCDRRQVGRSLNNLLKNAAESIKDRELANDHPLTPGTIHISLVEILAADGPCVSITIEDNGRGLPADNRERLIEPYVTSREKGTGLGLAIVKRIIEEHGGSLILRDAPSGGASISIALPTTKNAAMQVQPQQEHSDAFGPMKIVTGTVVDGS
jgi:two-component system nitrogen regulation sensor histidine kinase NtrY